MPESPARRTRRRVFAVATAVFTLAFAGAGITLQRRNTEAQDRIEAHLEHLRTEREARDFSRDAVWGETQDGAAWPHYRAAYACVADVSSSRRQDFVAALLVEASDDERALRAPLLREYRNALGHVRTGAHSRDATVDLEWTRSVDVEVPRLSGTRALTEVAVLALLEARTIDEEVDAVRALLDVQQLGRDLASSPQLICEMIGLDALAAAALRPHLERGQVAGLSTAAKEEWLRGLVALEQSLAPESIALAGELETLAQTFVSDKDALRRHAEGLIDSRLVQWRDALFLRSEVAEHLDTVIAVLPRIDASYRMEGSDAIERLQALHQELLATGNRLTARMAYLPRSAASSRLFNRARLSFVRHALELHLGVEGTEPVDVYGTGVTVERGGGAIRIATEVPGEEASADTLEVVFGE